MTNIHLEPLGNGMEIFVSDSYHFSTDTILLADFSQPANGKRCADLGTGCGTIPLLWLKRADKWSSRRTPAPFCKGASHTIIWRSS